MKYRDAIKTREEFFSFIKYSGLFLLSSCNNKMYLPKIDSDNKLILPKNINNVEVVTHPGGISSEFAKYKKIGRAHV